MNREGVYSKKTRGGKVSFERRRGSFIDRVATSIPLEEENERNIETIKANKQDSQIRRNLNAEIVELVMQNPFEKDDDTLEQMVEHISQMFPNESKVSIQTKIEHWQKKYGDAIKTIDGWIEQIKTGKKTKTSVDDSLRGVYSKYDVLRKPLKDYYNSKLKEISDMEEER